MAVQMAICVGAFCILLALMYYSATYLYPDGRSPDPASFIMFWLREIIVLLFGVGVLVLLVAAWAVQWIRRIGKTDKDGHSTKETNCRPQQADPASNVGRDD